MLAVAIVAVAAPASDSWAGRCMNASCSCAGGTSQVPCVDERGRVFGVTLPNGADALAAIPDAVASNLGNFRDTAAWGWNSMLYYGGRLLGRSDLHSTHYYSPAYVASQREFEARGPRPFGNTLDTVWDGAVGVMNAPRDIRDTWRHAEASGDWTGPAVLLWNVGAGGATRMARGTLTAPPRPFQALGTAQRLQARRIMSGGGPALLKRGEHANPPNPTLGRTPEDMLASGRLSTWARSYAEAHGDLADHVNLSLVPDGKKDVWMSTTPGRYAMNAATPCPSNEPPVGYLYYIRRGKGTTVNAVTALGDEGIPSEAEFSIPFGVPSTDVLGWRAIKAPAPGVTDVGPIIHNPQYIRLPVGQTQRPAGKVLAPYADHVH